MMKTVVCHGVRKVEGSANLVTIIIIILVSCVCSLHRTSTIARNY